MANNEQALVSTLEDLQNASKAILAQVTQLAEVSDVPCSCACHDPDSAQQAEKELVELKERLKALEAIVFKQPQHNPKDEHGESKGAEGGKSAPEVNITNISPREQNPGTDAQESDHNAETQPSASIIHEKETETIDLSNVAQVFPLKSEPRSPDQTKVESSIPNAKHGDSRSSKAMLKTSGSSVEIPSPNIKASSKTHPVPSSGRRELYDQDVDVFQQEETRLLAAAKSWEVLAQVELDSGIQTEIGRLEGAHTALLLDISESMAVGGAWRQANTFVDSFFNELDKVTKETNGLSNEYVAFVTFGHETRVVKRLTRDYGEIRSVIRSVRLGGPSPMVGGLLMALASILMTRKRGAPVGSVSVMSKIIVISDGHVTDARQTIGPDLMDKSKKEFIRDLERPLRTILARDIDIYFVPVGNANKQTVELMQNIFHRSWTWTEGAKLARRTYLATVAGPEIKSSGLTFNLDPNFRSDLPLSESDRRNVLELVSECNSQRVNNLLHRSGPEDPFHVSGNDQLLAVGTRVKRGPDWEEGNTNDKGGLGTVVGHFPLGHRLFVVWDDDTTQCWQYRYGAENCYDVLAVNDVRSPSPDGRLRVGCVVKPGKDVGDRYPRLQSSERGVVVAVFEEHLVGVTWRSGIKGIYDFIPGVREEVEYCPPSNDKAAVTNVAEDRKQQGKKSKNKNS